MKVRAVLLFLLVSFLSGCQEDHDSLIHHPSPQNVIGSWEGVSSIPLWKYASIKFDDHGNAKVIAAIETEVAVIGNLYEFQSQEHNFKIKFGLFDDEGNVADVQELVGEIRNEQLCFWFGEDTEAELKACFITEDDLTRIRKKASKLLNK
jgi:hypothetical protein